MELNICVPFDIDKGGLFNLIKLLSFDTDNTNIVFDVCSENKSWKNIIKIIIRLEGR